MKIDGKAIIGQITKSNPGVRFNATSLKATGIEVGDEVDIEYHKGKVVIKAVKV